TEEQLPGSLNPLATGTCSQCLLLLPSFKCSHCASFVRKKRHNSEEQILYGYHRQTWQHDMLRGKRGCNQNNRVLVLPQKWCAWLLCNIRILFSPQPKKMKANDDIRLR